MFVIVEEGNNITLGTVIHEPNDFIYLAFVMGICNTDDSQEMLESSVDVDSIARVLEKDKEAVSSQLESITKRSENEVSIFEWSTYVMDEENNIAYGANATGLSSGDDKYNMWVGEEVGVYDINIDLKAMTWNVTYVGTSAIENVQSKKNEISADTHYDLSGRRIMKPTKGLYIVNGKKVIK